MDRRLLKQIIYGAGYLFVFFSVVFIIYFVWLKPAPSCFDNKKNQGEEDIDCGGPCISCEIRTLAPLQISWLKNFPVGDKTIIAAEIKNPNLAWGAESFSYNLDIYDIYQNKIYTLTKKSFIYSGEIKFLAEIGLNIGVREIGDIKLSFSDIIWKPQNEFPRPETQMRGLKTDSTQPIKISGAVLNNNPYSLSKAAVVGFLYNPKGVLISASKTELGETSAFEEKRFQITFPPNISLSAIDATSTRIYVEAIR